MSVSTSPRVIVLRGQQLNPWELAQWQALPRRFDVIFVRSRSNRFHLAAQGGQEREVRTMRDLLPSGAVGDLAVRLPGDRYLGLRRALRDADIVHAQELGYWYSMQAARLKQRLGFGLVLTVWETLPFCDAYRNLRTRPYRRLTLAQTDLFLAATERARHSLLLEGAPEERIRVCPPGVDPARFVNRSRASSGRPEILSVGRLVWEKGHQDVIRAVAALKRGLVGDAGDPGSGIRLTIVGTGPERTRLQRHADELRIGDAVSFRDWISHNEMPGVYAGASCLVLASLPTMHWEEQFGMVLAEARAAGLPIVASTSGAIPEVLGGEAEYFSPGDWIGLARVLAADRRTGPAAGAADELSPYTTEAAAARLAEAYDDVLRIRPRHPEP